MFREFWETSDSEWLWTVDADMVFDKGHPMKLWLAAQDHEADMVAGMALLWKERQYPVPNYFYDREDGAIELRHNWLPPSGYRIAATGLASVLIHRNVIGAMSITTPRHAEYPWFDFLLNSDVGINGDEMTGIDVQFFMRARQLGYKLIAEPDAKTHHIEELYIGHDEWKRAWNIQS